MADTELLTVCWPVMNGPFASWSVPIKARVPWRTRLTAIGTPMKPCKMRGCRCSATRPGLRAAQALKTWLLTITPIAGEKSR